MLLEFCLHFPSKVFTHKIVTLWSSESALIWTPLPSPTLFAALFVLNNENKVVKSHIVDNKN